MIHGHKKLFSCLVFGIWINSHYTHGSISVGHKLIEGGTCGAFRQNAEDDDDTTNQESVTSLVKNVGVNEQFQGATVKR